MTVYYNDNDRHATAWLRNLIGAGLLPSGTIDTRSIHDVQPSELARYTQVHFFAGIGGWPLALSMAGWDRPVWTGSCPCQPFSTAGAGRGESDPRHLWPEFRRLIAECRPPTVFGEQVASRAGRVWLSGVRADLEALGYAVGAADLCAAGVGAPHIRQRLFWVADGDNITRQRTDTRAIQRQNQHHTRRSSGPHGGLGDSDSQRQQGGAQRDVQPETRRVLPRGADSRGSSVAHGGLGDTSSPRLPERISDIGIQRKTEQSRAGQAFELPGPHPQWSEYQWVECERNRFRRLKPGATPLAHGVSRGLVALRSGEIIRRNAAIKGLGNAIVPQLTAEFIRANL